MNKMYKLECNEFDKVADKWIDCWDTVADGSPFDDIDQVLNWVRDNTDGHNRFEYRIDADRLGLEQELKLEFYDDPEVSWIKDTIIGYRLVKIEEEDE